MYSKQSSKYLKQVDPFYCYKKSFLKNLKIKLLDLYMSNIEKKRRFDFIFPQRFKHQFHKMVKYTQKIRRQIAGELFYYVWLFCGIDD